MRNRGQPASQVRFWQYPDLRQQATKPARFVAWALACAIIVLSTVPPDLRPATPLPHNAEHFGIFWATGFAFGLGYRRRNVLLATLLVSFAAAIEIAQLFVPGRHARLDDFIVDALAICIGLFAVLLMDGILPSSPEI
jgi:VanZ family protein